MGRTGFLLLAFVLLLHCFVLLSAAGVNKPGNGGLATKAAGGDARELYAAASANDDFLDGGKKKARGGGKKHGSQSEKGRKVHTGKLAVVGRGSSVNKPTMQKGPIVRGERAAGGGGPAFGAKKPVMANKIV